TADPSAALGMTKGTVALPCKFGCADPRSQKRDLGHPSTCCQVIALHGSAAVPFVIPTRISCHAALDRAAGAPFREERRMKCINAINLNRKSGGAQPRDLQFSRPFLEM